MPKEIREIRNFNEGTLLNASERDIPDNSAAYSLNVNPLAEAGILSGIKNDKLFFASNNNITTLLTPVTWNAYSSLSDGNALNSHHPGSGRQTILANNIYAFNEQSSANVSFIGAKGKKENLIFNLIRPYMEREKVTSSLGLSYTLSGLATSATTIDFLTNTNAITENLADSELTVSGFTDGSATVTAAGTTLANFDGKILTIKTADGKEIVYEFGKDNDEGASSTHTSGALTAGGRTLIQLHGETTVSGIADEIEKAIEHANGHNGRITVSRDSGVLTLTDAGGIMSNHLNEDDYICLMSAGSAYTSDTNEIIKITAVNATSFDIQRGCFGTPVKTLAAGDYDVYANRITIDSVQIISSRALFNIYGAGSNNGKDSSIWSGKAGNHIGGNGQNFINGSDDKAGIYATDGSNATVTFNASAKTITFGTDFDFFPGTEGDTITLYASADKTNYGYTGKIVKKVDAWEVSLNNGITLTMDTAPLDETVTSGSLFFETNLIKNNTFHHAVTTSYQTVASDAEYKLNEWKHRCWYGASGIALNYWGFSALYSDDTLVTLQSSGGYWQTSPDMLMEDASADNSNTYYPGETSDKFVKLIQDYLLASSTIITESLSTTDTVLNCSAEMGQYVAKNDILKFSTSADSLSGDIEYMKVLSVNGTKLTVERGLYNSTPRTWDASNSNEQRIRKGVNTALYQSISKDKLKGNQQYRLSFYAQDNDCDSNNSAYGGLSLRVNGGYINVDGIWTEPSKDLTNGYGSTVKDVMQEDRWIPFQDLNKPNGDSAVDTNSEATDNGLDNIWRRFDIEFTLPEVLNTNLELEFSSRGKDTSYIYIDQVDLSENTLIVVEDNTSFLDSSGIIDNSGAKDLVFWDSVSNKLGAVKNIFGDPYKIPETTTDIAFSDFAPSDLTSSKTAFVANNRELHIGLGSRGEDSFPQWLGYVNRKVFGVDYSSELYRDDDTVHKYGAESSGALSKICVAGEHEYLAATWDSDHLDITHTGHSMNAGDNIVIREWADASNTWSGAGVWVVISSGTTADNIACKRYTTLDPNPSNTNFLQPDGDRDGNTGRICYRPYYYYGVRDGDAHIYRITPSDRIKADLSGLDDANYPAGKIERSSPLRAPLTSICTCHSKQSENTGGGKVYAMSNVSGDIYVVDVQVIYNAWTTTELADSIIRTEFRSFKWSNDAADATTSSNGNIGGGTGATNVVFGSIASESTPIIEPTGIMSDILETKGPTSTFIHAATAIDGSTAPTTGNDSTDFDTRLWIQFRPGGDDTFGEGSRFLFAGRTTSSNTSGENTIGFGDRTPPTNVLFPDYLNYNGGGYGYGGFKPGLSAYGWQGGNPNTDFPASKVKEAYALNKHWTYTHNRPAHLLERFGFLRKKKKGGSDHGCEWGSEHDYTAGARWPYINFGWNTGWQGLGSKFTAIKVAKYGLCPMSDNDKDGVIDGTGLLVPSTTSIQTGNPYGNLNQRVCGHAVGLIGGSEIPWTKYGGKILRIGNYFHGSHHLVDTNGEPYVEAPFDMKTEKCLFVCSDVHYGDSTPVYPDDDYYATYTAIEDGAKIDNFGGSDTNSDLLTLTLSSGTGATGKKYITASLLQAGDIVYLKDTGGDDFDISGVITNVDTSNNKITVDIVDGTPDPPNDTGIVFIQTSRLGEYSKNYINGEYYNHGIAHPNHLMFHFAYDEEDPMDGEIFTKGDACGAFSRKWYTKPTRAGGTFSHLPGIQSPVERLDYRAGYLIRPFDTSENTFEDLVLGNLTAVDIPAAPEALYHVKNGSNLHYHLNTSSTANNYATRMFIASSSNVSGESDKSKIYICDLNLNYPDQGNHIGDFAGKGIWGNIDGDDYNTMDGWDIVAAGTLGSSPYVHENSKTEELITVTGDRDMTSDTGFWTDSAGCTYDGTNDEWDVSISSGASDEDILTRASLLEVGTTYSVSFQVQNYTAGTVKVGCGTAYGTVRSANGVYTETITCAGNANFTLRTNTAGSANQTFSIDNISVKRAYSWENNAGHFPIVKLVDGNINNVTFGDWNFKYRDETPYGRTSPAGTRYTNGFHGLCLTVIDQNDGTSQTRFVVGSESAGITNADDVYLKMHWAFGREPQSGDKWYLSFHGNICTAPIRLLKEVELGHGLGSAFTKDPTLSSTIYKSTGSIGTIDGDGTTVTVTADDIHHLTTNDTIEITDTTNYDGIYIITTTTPKIFTFAQSDSTDHASESSGTWTVVRNTESSSINPIKTSISNPNLKTFFGGLDMRKLRGGAVSAIADDSDDIRLTSADHRLSVGDVITHKSDSTAAQDGVYVVKEGAGALPSATEDTFDVENTTSTNTAGDFTINQWESVITERGNKSKIGEIRSGFNQWDKGNIAGNPLRYDTDEDASSFYNITESGVTIRAASAGGISGAFFQANTRYEYKISLIYDGYQEGPLSDSSWVFEDNSSRSRLGITIRIKNFSKRLTHVCLYRRDTSSDFYKLVDEVSTSGGWNYTNGTHSTPVEDNGEVGASYSARTGMSEILDFINLKYGISAEVDGYLFAGDCAHTKIENASNMIFRSRPGMFSIFDYVNDFLTIKSKPTAMANFNGRLYVFDDSNIYRVNPHSLVTEDVYEGVGCLNSDCIVVTDYGMFFADKNGAYSHNGTTPQKISQPISLGGDISVAFGGTDNIRNLSWDSIIGSTLSDSLKISFLPRMNSVLFMVEFANKTDAFDTNKVLDLHRKEVYAWSYSITQNRWDLWEISKEGDVGKPFLGKDNKLYLSINEGIYEFTGGTGKKDFTWISKKLSMDQDSTIKVFNKVKVNGSSDNLNLDGTNLDSSQRLIVASDAGVVATGDMTYSSESSEHSTYKLSGSNRKGRWVQFKLEDMEKPVDSIGLIFRRRPPR